MISRRAVLAAMAGGLVIAPAPSQAESGGGMPVVGLLNSVSPNVWSDRLAAFRQGLEDAGFVDGRNVVLEHRWANGEYRLLPGLAADLVQRQAAVIVTLGSAASAVEAKRATSTIPVVFRTAGDPVELGLVASLSRPGGNVTGVTTLGGEIAPKQLELLREVMPAARSFALLINPTNTGLAASQTASLSQASAAMGLALHVIEASKISGLGPAADALARSNAGGLVVGADTYLNAESQRIAAMAAGRRIPSISAYREYTEAGGLLSYGGSVLDASRKVGVLTGRILKGERPADLPVQQPTVFEMVVNLKTARALGLAIPSSVLIRADEVIE